MRWRAPGERRATDDDGGLPAFVAARGAALLRYGWLLTADVDAAEDLVQEALARALPRWHRIEPGAREAYVRTAMRSVWIDGWRRRGGRVLTLVPEVPDTRQPDPTDGVAGRLALEDALARLAPRQRAVLVLRFYDDLTEAETARVLGCSTSTVKSQARDGLARLRALAPHLDLSSDPSSEVTA